MSHSRIPERKVFPSAPEILCDISKFLSDREKYQFSMTSKNSYSAIKEMPYAMFEMIEINGIKVKKIIYDQLIKKRKQCLYDRYIHEEAYLTVKDDEKNKGRKLLHFSELIYKNPSLICAMIEDKGFRSLLKSTHPEEAMLRYNRKINLLTRIKNSIFLGLVGFLGAITAFVLLFPAAAMIAGFVYISAGWPLICETPIRLRNIGLPIFVSPLTIVYSTIAAVYIGFYVSLSLNKVKSFFLNAFSFMYDWCFAPYYYRECLHENTWYKSWQATQIKTFADIAEDYRKKNLKETAQLTVPTARQEKEIAKSSQATLLSCPLKVNCKKIKSQADKLLNRKCDIDGPAEEFASTTVLALDNASEVRLGVDVRKNNRK